MSKKEKNQYESPYRCSFFETDKRPARKLPKIAAWINEHLPELEARTESVTECTDTEIAGTRLRRPGKGRKGTRLGVYKRMEIGGPVRATGHVSRHSPWLLYHSSGETYRRNYEVEEWLQDYLRERPKGLPYACKKEK